MGAQELSIGSLVLFDFRDGDYCKIFSVVGIDGCSKIDIYSSIDNIEITEYSGSKMLSPIELTVDWLLLFGFEKLSDEVYYLEDDTLGCFEYITSEGLYFQTSNFTEIKYVHEFQQFYRLINKKPLEIDIEKLKVLADNNRNLYY